MEDYSNHIEHLEMLANYGELLVWTQDSKARTLKAASAIRELQELTDRQVKRTGKLTGQVDALLRQVKERVAEIDTLQEDCTAWRVRVDIDTEHIGELEAETGKHDAAKAIAQAQVKELEEERQYIQQLVSDHRDELDSKIEELKKQVIEYDKALEILSSPEIRKTEDRAAIARIERARIKVMGVLGA